MLQVLAPPVTALPSGNSIQQALESRDFDRASAELEACPEEGRQLEWWYLKRQCNADLFTLTGHSASVEGVAVSPDAGRLASVGKDGTVLVWDVAGQEVL